jgi:hypothetical protein
MLQNTITKITSEDKYIENDDNIDILLKASDDNINIIWTAEHEKILVDWADKAMCYRWLHNKSNLNYTRLNVGFTIPVIIMSTLTGTANFAISSYPEDYKQYASMIIGGVNIFAGILTTIQQFLKVSELKEAHRVSALAWDKFYRNIKIEIAKNPNERINVTHVLKTNKEQFDNLMETSPIINQGVIDEFKNTFNPENMKNNCFNYKKIEHEKIDIYKKIKKPDICDELVPTDDLRYDWYKTTSENLNYLELLKIVVL